MSTPRQTSLLAADLQVSCPILQSLTDSSGSMAHTFTLAKLSRMDSIPEESWEPEDDTCQPCSERPEFTVEEVRAGQSPAITEIVAKVREGIEKQGQRLQREEEKHASAEGPRSPKENETLDFHIKVVGRKRPAPLFLDAKAHGKDLLSGVKSKVRRVTFALTKKPVGNGAKSQMHSPPPKQFSLTSLANQGKKRVFSIKSRGKRTTVLYPLTWSKQSKKSEARPKLKSKNKVSRSTAPAKDTDKTQYSPDSPYSPSSSGTLVQQDDRDGDDVPLLSIKSPASSSMRSIDASYFYTPMVPARKQREYEYRLDRSRFRRSVNFATKAFSKSAGSVKHHASNVLSVRRKRGGWSILE